GKTALLAGAIDERIALTVPHISGAGGAGCYRFPDAGGERLADLIEKIPYWFTPRLREYVGRESELPFDQHFLKAAVAPRALLSTDTRGDLWASPRGTRLTYEAARVVYRLLGAESRIGIWFREGGHAHTLPDWEALLDFADLQFHGKPAARDFDLRP
ncbi:acetylxylan esterase, partial [bacterium]|nr:acetylxylan esterase [bacterium]